MLKIKSADSMRKLKPLTPFYSGFSERIRTNYGCMNVRMEKEELIHLVSEPPEVYLEDFGMTTLTNTTNVNSTKNVKIEMLNEMINRLYYSDNHHFTYQDKVYVENVLRKLGVENTSQFIKQVKEIKEQMDETINYIRINENNPVAFRSMMERIIQENGRIPEKKNEGDKEVLASRKEKELYEKVFDRLHSKEIYKEVTELLRANPDMPAIIRQAEFHLAEQKNESRELTLNSIFHTFEGDTRNYLVHRWEELNEGDDVVEVTENGDILSSVNASIIMNLIENVMSLRAGDKYIRDEQWYQLKNAYNQSAENTLNRFFTDRTLSVFHIIEENDYSRQIEENIIKETDELVYKSDYVENLQQEALNEINIRNQQKLEEIRQLEQQIVINNQITNPVPDRKNIYNTSQLLLEHPELSGEIIGSIPDNTIQNTVYDQIKEVIVNQVADPFTRELLVHLAENGRPGDITELENISRQQEVVRNITEQKKQVEQVAKNIEVEQRTLTLVHKTEEQTISEDILDEIRQQRNYVDNRLVEVTQNVNTTETNHTEVVNQIDNEEVVRNIQNNVMEMVDKNIKGQVDSISNQVFRRLEKKLDTERKRRGY
ncbi:hypothetical protein [Pseudobutyrivibrio sp. MD2005]|uniref:hypothetical protein n=1 Tax=Pseudobutyrivibrio sp. MD2005 TaxID=1410616 RepID=UPI00047F146F|nr:hypothetical protein [Pseudobutyrivibrio sp. MD2005]